MGTLLKCFICDSGTNRISQKSVFEIRTRHSRKPIVELLERFQSGSEAIQAHDGSSNCVLCDDCIEEIDAYDEACQLVEQVGAKLKKMLAETKERYQNTKNVATILETEQIEANRSPKKPVSNPNVIFADPFELDEMNDSFDYDNDTDLVTMSEEEFQSEEEDFDSDDSFVWPKSSTLKWKREKVKGKKNVKKKPHVYKCIDCPADYRDKYEMQVIIESILSFSRASRVGHSVSTFHNYIQ